MSRSFSVVVLCPNARREIVKVTPNSSILQVLEEACKRQNINPEDYDLRHSNKTLDLSLPIRFSNLPNNAQVELRPAENSRKDCLVTVCVQLESGERFTADFPPSASVYDVAEQCLKSDSISMQDIGEPVCIYMRQKIAGDSIKTTTLRSLGLTKGKAIIRLLYRKPEELEQQAHVSTPLGLPPVQQDPMPQQREFRQPDSPIPEQIRKQSRLDPLADEFKPTEIKMEPVEEKMASVKETPSVQYSDRDSVHIKEEKGEENIEMDSSDQTIEMECDLESPEDTFQGVGDIKYIGERHAVLYNLDDITDIKKADLPDEFFDLTVNDVRYLMEEYKKERSELENQPLLTKEQRQRNILHKLTHYTQTVIRVYFPERLVLQAVFTSLETVQTISDFIRNYLEDRNLNFYLYVTPPKEKLDSSKTLLEAMLVPAAVIYFGCESQQPNYLSLNLRDQLSDPRAASLAASESRKSSITNVPVDIPCENVIKEETKLEDANLVVHTVPHSENSQNPEKVPKWLKLSRK